MLVPVHSTAPGISVHFGMAAVMAAGPLAQMKGVFGAEKQHVENRHISLVPPYSLKALNTIYPLTVAPHSSILAWKIPWMEEPDRLQSMGSLRVGHD